MGKSKKATWFKTHMETYDLIHALSDEQVGRLYKAALKYFKHGEIIDIDNLGFMDPTERLAFIPFKQACDEALEDYRKAVEFGTKGASKRWKEETDSPPIAPL